MGLNLRAWVANNRQIVFTFAVWAMEMKRQEGEKGNWGEEWRWAPLAWPTRATCASRAQRPLFRSNRGPRGAKKSRVTLLQLRHVS